MELIGLTKSINILGSGKKIVFGVKENFLEMKKFSLKAYFKRVLNMEMGNINMIMGIYLKEIILRIRKEEKVDTTSMKEEP